MKTIVTLFTNTPTISCNTTLIIGLSGGPDSVFLLHFLHYWQKELSLTLIAAHLDHQWRENSANDVEFCKQLCQRYQIPFVSQQAKNLDYDGSYNGSQEDAGRRLRRYYFEQVKKEYNADYIALGHHAQDQQETFFIRLLRGSTLSGLTGIKAQEKHYIRPLLLYNKQDIFTYLHEHSISYLIDPTNNSNLYLRNRIRHHVIPALEAADQRFNHNFSRTLEHLQQTENFLAALTKKTFEEIAILQDNCWHVSFEQLLKYDPFMQKRIILFWLIAQNVPFVPSSAFLQEISNFLHNNKSTNHQLNTQWILYKKHNYAFIKQHPNIAN